MSKVVVRPGLEGLPGPQWGVAGGLILGLTAVSRDRDASVEGAGACSAPVVAIVRGLQDSADAESLAKALQPSEDCRLPKLIHVASVER